MKTTANLRRFLPILLLSVMFTSAAAAAVVPSEVRLKAGSFDPRAGAPARPQGAEHLPEVATIRSARGGRYYLVQFSGPVMPEWQQQLRSAGVEVLRYVPDFAFITRMTRDEEALVSALPFVRFVGPYKPEWRVDPEVMKALRGTGGMELTIVVHEGESLESLIAALRKTSPSLTLLKAPAPGATKAIVRVNSGDLIRMVRHAAEHESLAWIEPWLEPRLLNNESVWVVQNGTRVAADVNSLEYPSSAPIWAHDILGTGQIVTVADSGLTDNDCFFSPAPAHQNVAAPGALTVNNALRKVIAYNWFPGGADGDSGDPAIGYHGSHVAGSVAGDNSANLSTATAANHNSGDGMAPNAKIIFQDIGGVNNLAGIPNDLRDMFTQAYNAGGRIHTNSWGAGAEGQYTTNSQEVDDYNYRMGEDMLVLFAASNDGAGVSGNKLVGGENDTIGSPATAKNALTVGGTSNGGAATAAGNLIWFSSRGNTDDGRLKPEIVAPGYDIVSHNGDATACNTQPMSGTSMSTPTTAGAAALARQYFTEGWYPTGTKVAADGFSPTAAALKAVLTAGARPIPNEDFCDRWSAIMGTCARTATRAMTASPNSMQGWGRLTLIDSLSFATAPNSNVKLKLWDVPNLSGVTTGRVAEYTLPSVVAGTRLHINLAWSDPPATLGAAKALVNDLNLEVIAPNGTTIYRGNQWAATAAGLARESAAGAAAWDNTNNLEGVQIAAPAAGDYRIRVHGLNIPGYNGYFENRQGYAIAATGNFSATCSLSAPAGLTATASAANQVSLSWTAVAGATKYAIYRSIRGQAACATGMSQIGQSTGTTFVDTTVEGGFQYSYHVKAIAPCYSAASNCSTVTSTGNCTLKPTFGGVTSVTNAGGLCALTVSWNPATSNCPLGPVVKYNVYRGTTANFVPAAANRVASCVTGTSFTDTGRTDRTTYHYVVRAEDGTTANGGPCNGGNEDLNSVRRWATVQGTGTGASGTWTDGGGDTTAQLTLGGTWSIVSNSDKAGYARTGSYAYKTSPGTTNYPTNACITATTPTLTVATAGNPVVTFWERHDLEFDFDGVVVETSVNGGAWTAVGAIYNRTFGQAGNACGYATTRACYQSATGTETLTAYAQRTFTITAAAGSTVAVRWVLSSDGGVEEEGFVLDDLSITNIAMPSACVNCVTPGVPATVTATTPSTNTIRVAWAAGSPAGASYNVYRSAGACPGGTFALLASGITGSSYDDTTVAGGSAYSYKVSAVDSTNSCESALSACAGTTATGGPGLHSRGRFVSSRPVNTADAATAVRWVYSTGATAMVPPGIGSVYPVSNDRMLHGMEGGVPTSIPPGGQWITGGFKPFLMNAPSQSRPGVPTLNGTKYVFLGSQDGKVYAVNGNSGALIWSSAVLGDMVQSAVNGLFTAYGGAYDLLFAPTRNSSTANSVHALKLADGTSSWPAPFTNGGGGNGIGIINSDVWVDYGEVTPGKNKIYFASRRMTGGSQGTIWCVEYTATTAQLCSEPGSMWPAAIGDIDGSPTLFQGRLYVGNNAGTLYALNATTGATIWSRPMGDGPIKGFVDVDFMAAGLPRRLWVATTNGITAVDDTGATSSVVYNVPITRPAIPIYTGTAIYAGGGDGKLYELTNVGAASPTVKSVTLGTGAAAVGSPSFDVGNNLVYVGTEDGKVYAVAAPLP